MQKSPSFEGDKATLNILLLTDPSFQIADVIYHIPDKNIRRWLYDEDYVWAIWPINKKGTIMSFISIISGRNQEYLDHINNSRS